MRTLNPKLSFSLLAFAVGVLLIYGLFGGGSGSGFGFILSRSHAPPPEPLVDAQGKCLNAGPDERLYSHGMLNKKVAIVLTVLRDSDYLDYKHALDTLHCYADYYGYHLELINMTADPRVDQVCNQTDKFFKRHCAVVDFMERNERIFDHILYLDADIGVVNPCHRIQEYIHGNTADITFYDRYYNDEIMAGSYLARNTPFSRKFLKFWADYFYRLPQSFHGTDNGAIQQVFMELHFAFPEDQMQCYHLWNKSQGFDDLFAFEICTRHALGDGSDYIGGKARIIRKGSRGWARDGWLTGTVFSPEDFLFHGWKTSKLGGEWVWPFAAPTFDRSKCQSDTPFVGFVPAEQYSKTEAVVMSKLKEKADNGRKNYFAVLEKLGLYKPPVGVP